jgi:FHS family L-fucose permease-like MFS transporter
MRVVVPYLIWQCSLVMAILILRTRFPEVNEGEHDEKKQQGRRFRDLFSHSHFVKGVIAQFFLRGAQVGTWSYFIQYTQDYTGQDEKTAGYFLTGRWLPSCWEGFPPPGLCVISGRTS